MTTSLLLCKLPNYARRILACFALSILTLTCLAQEVVWKPNGISSYGPSPFLPTSINAGLTSTGLKRGGGVGTGGTGAGSAWGGNDWAADAASGLSNSKFIEFDVSPKQGYKTSLITLNLFYRHSGTGPNAAMLQFAKGANSYTSIGIISFPSSSNSGAAASPVDLSGIAALQNIENSSINFRLIPYGASTANGTWYVYGSGLSINADIQASGTNCSNIVFNNGENFTVGTFGSTNPSGPGLANPLDISAIAWTCNANGFPICNQRSLFKLDLTSIPTGTHISSATLKLYAKTDYPYAHPGQPTYGTANTGLLQKITAPWQPTDGWDHQPPVDVNAQKVLPQSNGTAQNYEIDVTSLVQDWINNPSTNYGVLFRLQTEQYYNSLVFHAGSPSSAEGLRPHLLICYDQVQPLDLLLFDGKRQGKSTLLQWTTANEKEVRHFEIERSSDGRNFSNIGIIAAKNTGRNQAYSYEDVTDLNTDKIYYRLKMVDNDGKITYSKTISVDIKKTQPITISIAPNPVRKELQIQIGSNSSTQGVISIHDATGKLLLQRRTKIIAGQNQLLINETSAFKTGIYFVTISAQDCVVSKKIIIEQ